MPPMDKLSGDLERALVKALQPGEKVLIKGEGVFGEAVACTDGRVLIIKTGYMTGHMFGSGVFQLPYSNITSAEVNFNLLTGYFELSAGGMQNTRKSYWSSQSNIDPKKAPNCIALNRSCVERFREAATFIMAQRAPTTHEGRQSATALLEQLADLHARGILTASEYAAKKAEVLARL